MKIKVRPFSLPQTFITTVALVVLAGCNTGNINANSNSDHQAVESTLAKTGVVNISSKQLQELRDKNVTLIDIRRPEEWAQTGVVPGSKKLTFFSKSGAINPQLVPELKKIAPIDKPVILICRTGNRTRVASQILTAQLGYKTVYNVTHGITRWVAEGNKTVK